MDKYEKGQLPVRRRSIYYFFSLIMVIVTFSLCEIAFRAYDYFTMPQGNLNMDVWIKNISQVVEDHPLLGYRYPPKRLLDEQTQADEFGMRNVREALTWDRVDVIGVGDSYVDNAHRVFFERFKTQGFKYHSLALFGYGPANYNVMMREYGSKLSPKVYLYTTYLGNDSGDIRRYENWLASGKGWYELNGGYVFPIERQGLVWGWRLFIGRTKSFARNLISRANADSYGALRSFVKRDDAETIFEYVLQAKEIASKQQAELLVTIVPRTADHKRLLDPIAGKLVSLCVAKGIECLDLDPAFGEIGDRYPLFAPDGHWNEAGMNAAWSFLWERKLKSLLEAHGIPKKRQ